MVINMSEKRFSETERNCYYTSLVFDNKTQEELGTNKSVKLLNALYEENESLRKENEEYEKESEDMQTKINVLYNEAKKHMSSTEWEKFIRRIIEREEELGIKWVRL